MEQLPQTRMGMSKLTSPPVKVKIYLSYKPGDTDTDPGTPVDGTSVDAWIHPLTAQEWSDCETVSVEGYRHFRAKGGDHDDSNWKSNRLFNCQQIMYSVRTSDKDGATRLFNDEIEVMQINSAEITKLISEYTKAFVPSREEIKNSLRERLGQSSETPSTSPATSEILA